VAVTQTNLAWETLLELPPARRGEPLHMRLAAAIRAAIRDGRLPSGAALPPSRVLAGSLSVSRWTVTQAYSQLATEGYLAGRQGSATRVSWSPASGQDRPAGVVRPSYRPMRREARFDLSYSRPDLRAFPRRQWVAAIAAVAETASFDELDYAEAGGHERLRAVLAGHLSRSRGASAEAATVSVFTGAGQSMSQVAHALLADGHTAIGVEDVGSQRLWHAARTAGLRLVGLPVDDDGLVTDALAEHPGLRAVCVGAARQVVYGTPLAPGRRAALLEWARRADGVIVEDDYDCEFSYEQPTPPVMQGSDPDRVALLGSMNRVLNPSVSIGWVVAPRRLVPMVRTERQVTGVPSALNQLALAQFMESGSYDRYLRRARTRFRARRSALVSALELALPECRVRGSESGLDLLLELPDGTDSGAVVVRARRQGLRLCSGDAKHMGVGQLKPGLLIGYGNLPDTMIDEAVGALAEVIRSG
jgi:GntR family transcriptional regulator / MocR family aminotransferase